MNIFNKTKKFFKDHGLSFLNPFIHFEYMLEFGVYDKLVNKKIVEFLDKDSTFVSQGEDCFKLGKLEFDERMCFDGKYKPNFLLYCRVGRIAKPKLKELKKEKANRRIERIFGQYDDK